MADGSTLTELTTCANAGEAGALRSRLEAEGIPAIVQGEHHSAMLGTVFGGIIDVRVMVPEAALARASELLATWEAEARAAANPGAGQAEMPKDEDGHPRCADHAAPSVGTCVRCGAFVCEACVGGATEDLLCPACDARANEAPSPRRRKTRTVAVVLLAWMALPILLALLYGGFRAATGR